MKIRIIWVGRTKEAYLDAGIKKYLKLIGHTARIEIIEIKEEKEGQRERMLREEGQRILKKTASYALLDEKGTSYDSRGFASFISGAAISDYVLGGAFGVSDDIKEKASVKLSLSPMTFTHEMSRLIFLEQLYRAMTINSGRDYHH